MTSILIRKEIRTKTRRKKQTKKTMLGHSKKAAICKSGREASEETKPGNNLMLDFRPPKLWENECLLSHSVSGMAALDY